MFCFLAILWDPTDKEAQRSALEYIRQAALPAPRPAVAAQQCGLYMADLSGPGDAAEPLILRGNEPSDRGFVFGRLFTRCESLRPTPRLTRLSPQDSQSILDSGGVRLHTDYWGPYVAFIRHTAGHVVVSDPAGSIPCFLILRDGVTYAFSHLEHAPAFLRKGMSLNRQFVSGLVAYDKVQNGETGLNGVREQQAGERILINAEGHTVLRGWDPRRIARHSHEPSATAAAERLRRTAFYVTGSLATAFPNPVLNLSGGLDSAIVGACLRKSGTRVHCVHFLTGGGDPPEADYARRAAHFLGFALEEIPIDAHDPLPRPETHPLSARPFREFLGMPQMARLEAHPRFGGRPVFTGQGGDHLFLETRSIAQLTDYLCNQGLNLQSGRVLLETAHLSGRSVWSILRDTVRHYIGKAAEPTSPEGRQTRVSGEALTGADWMRLVPDWAREPEGLPPGKFAQVSSLLHMYQIRRVLSAKGSPPTIHPLISQPMTELCLSLPTYLLCAGGRSRGLARQAFAGLIPDEIRLRQSKGDASRFYIAQLVANRELLRQTLMEGELATLGLIDRRDVEQFFASEDFRLLTSGRMLLVHYVIEAWLQSWKSHLKSV